MSIESVSSSKGQRNRVRRPRPPEHRACLPLPPSESWPQACRKGHAPNGASCPEAAATNAQSLHVTEQAARAWSLDSDEELDTVHSKDICTSRDPVREWKKNIMH